jgi:hypothetical protein
MWDHRRRSLRPSCSVWYSQASERFILSRRLRRCCGNPFRVKSWNSKWKTTPGQTTHSPPVSVTASNRMGKKMNRPVSGSAVGGMRRHPTHRSLDPIQRKPEDFPLPCLMVWPRIPSCFVPSQNGGGLAFIGFGVCVGWILFQAHRTRGWPEKLIVRWILPACCLFFGTIGIFLLVGLSWPVWRCCILVRGWNEVPATVVWSRLKAEGGGRKRHDRADICHEYRIDGKTWRNNHLRPGDISGLGDSGEARLVSRYPPGLRTRCYVNSSNPARALLIMGVGWNILLTLFPLPFMAVGAMCAMACLRSLR